MGWGPRGVRETFADTVTGNLEPCLTGPLGDYPTPAMESTFIPGRGRTRDGGSEPTALLGKLRWEGFYTPSFKAEPILLGFPEVPRSPRALPSQHRSDGAFPTCCSLCRALQSRAGSW